jgi:hypothetical protein
MTDKKVTLEMDVFSAAAVRQVLFDAQKGYAYEHVPARIVGIRQVILDLDEAIGAVVESD